MPEENTTYIEEANVYQCDDCGAHAPPLELIPHFDSCKTGESKRWQEIYSNLEPEDFTCYECDDRKTCPFVDDLYNTGGECLAMK